MITSAKEWAEKIDLSIHYDPDGDAYLWSDPEDIREIIGQAQREIFEAAKELCIENTFHDRNLRDLKFEDLA